MENLELQNAHAIKIELRFNIILIFINPNFIRLSDKLSPSTLSSLGMR